MKYPYNTWDNSFLEGTRTQVKYEVLKTIEQNLDDILIVSNNTHNIRQVLEHISNINKLSPLVHQLEGLVEIKDDIKYTSDNLPLIKASKDFFTQVQSDLKNLDTATDKQKNLVAEMRDIKAENKEELEELFTKLSSSLVQKEQEVEVKLKALEEEITTEVTKENKELLDNLINLGTLLNQALARADQQSILIEHLKASDLTAQFLTNINNTKLLEEAYKQVEYSKSLGNDEHVNLFLLTPYLDHEMK